MNNIMPLTPIEKIIRNFLLMNTKMVVFDFDQTIINTHCMWLVNTGFYNFIDKNGIIEWNTNPYEYIGKDLEKWKIWFVEKPDLKDFSNHTLFKELICSLLKNNIKVAIASFGYNVIIRVHMDLLFGRDQTIFTDKNITTPCDFEKVGFKYIYRDPLNPKGIRLNECNGELRNKNYQIKLLANRFDLKPHEMLLIDDNSSNVSDAQDLGMMALQSTKKGMTTEWFNYISNNM